MDRISRQLRGPFRLFPLSLYINMTITRHGRKVDRYTNSMAAVIGEL